MNSLAVRKSLRFYLLRKSFFTTQKDFFCDAFKVIPSDFTTLPHPDVNCMQAEIARDDNFQIHISTTIPNKSMSTPSSARKNVSISAAPSSDLAFLGRTEKKTRRKKKAHCVTACSDLFPCLSYTSNFHVSFSPFPRRLRSLSVFFPIRCSIYRDISRSI